MPSRLEELEMQAMDLPDQARAELVGRLLRSLSQSAEFDANWSAEVDRRIDEIEARRADLLPTADVIARVRDAIR